MLDADRPIVQSDEDRLDRRVFANTIAHSIFDRQDAASLTVGLLGEAGSGKTSLLNLIIAELNYAATYVIDADKPLIIRFNAWNYSGQKNIARHFLSLLAQEVRNFLLFSAPKRLATLIQAYHDDMQDVVMKKSFIHQPLNRSQLKENIDHILEKENHQIIVCIDNIAHLPLHEIQELMQLTRSIADFSRMVFIVALHPKQHADLVDQWLQVRFTIPAPHKQELAEVLLAKLEPLVALMPENSWDTFAWTDLYLNTLHQLFNNCHDITRYVNALNFNFPRVKDVVYPIDFFGLMALELFAPKIHAGIYANKDLFTDMVDNLFDLDEKKMQRDKIRCDEIIHRESSIPATLALELLIHLFPRMSKLYYPNTVHTHSRTHAKDEHRICDADAFDIYFRHCVGTRTFSSAEFATIINFLKDKDTFDQALHRLNQENRVLNFLDNIDRAVITSLSVSEQRELIKALCNNGDFFPNPNFSHFKLNTFDRVYHICRQILVNYSPEEREDLLSVALQAAVKSLSINIHLLNAFQQEALKRAKQDAAFTAEAILRLQAIVVRKIKSWAEQGTLPSHPHLHGILATWLNWDNPLHCQNYVEDLTKEDRGLLAFLCAVFEKPIRHMINKLQKPLDKTAMMEQVRLFIEPQKLAPLATALFKDANFEKMREDEQLAVLLFLDGVEVRALKVIPKTTV